MRVLVVADRSHPDHDLAFLRALVGRCDVALFGPDIPVIRAGVKALGVRAHLVDWPRHRQALRFIQLVRSIAAHVQAEGYDLVHVLSEGQVWMNLLPALLGRTPMVATLHDVLPHPGDASTRRVPRLFVNAFVRQAAATLVHGEGLRSMAVERLRMKPERLFVGVHPAIHHYQDLVDRKRSGLRPDRPFHVLFFGRIFRYKGLRHLIAAEPLFAPEIGAVVTTIAGAGEDFTPYAEAMAAPERFDVRNRYIPDEEAADLFARSHVLVLPYIEASQSGVLAIAAAFGLPVVATDVGELGDLVRATNVGLVVPPGDPKALASAIIALARDKALRERCAVNGAAALEGPLSDEAVFDYAAAAYRAVLKKGPA